MKEKRKGGYTDRWFGDNSTSDPTTLNLINFDEIPKERIKETI